MTTPASPSQPGEESTPPAMSEQPTPIDFPTYCWCGMCGYSAKVKPEDVPKFTAEHAQVDCDDCERHGMTSFLSFGSMEDMDADAVAPDEEMLTYPETHDEY